MLTCIMFPLIRWQRLCKRMQRFSRWPKSHPSHSDGAADSIYCTARQLRDGAGLCCHVIWPESRLWKRQFKHSVYSLRPITVMHGGERCYSTIWKCFHLLQRTQLLIIFHVSVGVVFIGDFAIWCPRWANIVRPNPILDHWCVQSFRVKTQLWGVRFEKECEYVSLENQCTVKHNTSCVSASLWINVQRIENNQNKYHYPPSAMQDQSYVCATSSQIVHCFFFFLQKINICLYTVLRGAWIWNGRCALRLKCLQSWGTLEMIHIQWFKRSDMKGLIWIQTIWFSKEGEIGTRCTQSKECVVPRITFCTIDERTLGLHIKQIVNLSWQNN